MSRDAKVDLKWADGTHTFRLAWGGIIELQEKCDAGPHFILNRLHDDSWHAEDISNVIRLGLIGGGMPPAAALALVERYVEQRPLLESRDTARAILFCALVGAPDEDETKKKSRRGTKTRPAAEGQNPDQ
ncbi:MAG: gene transfer agent family protein [Alphaproteobacteria bacterium]|nr:gene transfer agent family protein [Alphaproteobacteria bacterium]